MTQENDIVLIHYEDDPMSFARVEDISPDVKPGWYHVKLLLLQVPLQVVTWILRDAYIDGSEFTMGGKRMRLEKIECPEDPDDGTDLDDDEEELDEAPEEGKVISLTDRFKK